MEPGDRETDRRSGATGQEAPPRNREIATKPGIPNNMAVKMAKTLEFL